MLSWLFVAGILGAGVYNAVKDEDSRTQTKKTFATKMDQHYKKIDRYHKEGKITDEKYDELMEKYEENKPILDEWKKAK